MNPGPQAAGVVQLQNLFVRLIGLVVALGFVVMLVVLVVAGIKFLTSGGEPKAVASASQALTWALLGMLFMALAWLVLRLVFAFAGIEMPRFCIGFAPLCT